MRSPYAEAVMERSGQEDTQHELYDGMDFANESSMASIVVSL